jgi:stalled ribosome alternative rescue factor ArfA
LEKNLVIKEPVGSHAADIIMECFPNSKLVFLQRDGRDVVASRIDMHGKNTWASLKTINPNQRIKSIKWYSYQWVKINERINRAYTNHNPDLRMVVRYEDLKKNTLSELRRIYHFLNIEITDNQLEEIISKHDFKKIPEKDKGQGKFYRSASPGGWKDNFEENEQDLMNSIMRKTLTQFGYSI